MSRGLGCGEGLRGYRPKGSGRLLSPKEEQEVQRLIQDPTPHPLKMYYALWTRPAVSDSIVVRYGIPLQVRTLDKHLKRWRYPRNPLKKACEQSPVAVGKWQKETCQAIYNLQESSATPNTETCTMLRNTSWPDLGPDG